MPRIHPKGKNQQTVNPTRPPMTPSDYVQQIQPLHTELVKMQNWVKSNGLRIVMLFEGRDTSGKGGTIKRLTEHMNPRGCQIVALDIPTDKEKSQWYFQRYVRYLPSAGEIVLFDRSWYNRAGEERVMGFCTEREAKEFLRTVPAFEKMLVRSGIILFKFYFSVNKAEQMRRLKRRLNDPLKWRMPSLVERKASNKWKEYTQAKEEMFFSSSTVECPWTIIKSEDKLTARIENIKYLLSQLDYTDKIDTLLRYDPHIVRTVQEEMGAD